MFGWFPRIRKQAAPESDADALIEFARRLRASGELDKAIVTCQRALSIAPDSPLALYQLGNALNGQGRRGEAIACYRKALAA